MAHDHTVLVLQGGGALGAYQAGVYEGLAEQGFAPDWLAGVSIGAINGALIAGNPVERRLERLREFWNRVSSGLPWNPLAHLAPLRAGLNRFSALAAATFGVPGFFSPRMPPAFLAPDATPEALSIYDTSPLRRTLGELVDFDFLNREQRVRLSVGSVNVHTGNSVYFDNRERELGADHIMASGSLPPGFPPVMIEGEHLLGRRHRLQFAVVVRPGRFTEHQCVDRAGRSLQREGRAPGEPRSGARAREGHPVFEQDAVQHQARAGARHSCAVR